MSTNVDFNRAALADHHKDIWTAIDCLAFNNKLSASGLEKKAGLDATTFNPSKRFHSEKMGGQPRWPSTESIARILICTDTSFTEFAQLQEKSKRIQTRYIPNRL